MLGVVCLSMRCVVLAVATLSTAAAMPTRSNARGIAPTDPSQESLNNMGMNETVQEQHMGIQGYTYTNGCKIGMGFSLTQGCLSTPLVWTPYCSERAVDPYAPCLHTENKGSEYKSYLNKISTDADESDTTETLVAAEGSGWGMRVRIRASSSSPRSHASWLGSPGFTASSCTAVIRGGCSLPPPD